MSKSPARIAMRKDAASAIASSVVRYDMQPAQMNIYVYACIYKCESINLCTCIFMYLYVYVYMYIYIYIDICIYG